MSSFDEAKASSHIGVFVTMENWSGNDLAFRTAYLWTELGRDKQNIYFLMSHPHFQIAKKGSRVPIYSAIAPDLGDTRLNFMAETHADYDVWRQKIIEACPEIALWTLQWMCDRLGLYDFQKPIRGRRLIILQSIAKEEA